MPRLKHKKNPDKLRSTSRGSTVRSVPIHSRLHLNDRLRLWLICESGISAGNALLGHGPNWTLQIQSNENSLQSRNARGRVIVRSCMFPYILEKSTHVVPTVLIWRLHSIINASGKCKRLSLRRGGKTLSWKWC